MTTSSKTSEALRQRWADPEWAARQRERIAEGAAKRWRGPTVTKAKTDQPTKARFKDRRAVTVYMDRETFDELHQRAVKQKCTLTELINTYVEWGLENDQ